MFEDEHHSDLAFVQRDQRSGIIVLSLSGRVLHINKAARGFASLALNVPARPLADDLLAFHLPSPLQEFSERVSMELEKRIAADEWTQFEMKQVVRAAGLEFLLRGFGLPDKLRRQQSRILLTLQPIAVRLTT